MGKSKKLVKRMAKAIADVPHTQSSSDPDLKGESKFTLTFPTYEAGQNFREILDLMAKHYLYLKSK